MFLRKRDIIKILWLNISLPIIWMLSIAILTLLFLSFILHSCNKTILIVNDPLSRSVSLSERQFHSKKYFQFKAYYNWLNTDLYLISQNAAHKNNIPVDLIFAVINSESGGQNIRSRIANSDGTFDHGIAQINEVHLGSHEFETINDFYNLEKNINFAAFYLRRAMEKSLEQDKVIDYRTVIRLYNQGLNGQKKFYPHKQWEYVLNVYYDFTRTFSP